MVPSGCHGAAAEPFPSVCQRFSLTPDCVSRGLLHGRVLLAGGVVGQNVHIGLVFGCYQLLGVAAVVMPAIQVFRLYRVHYRP